MLQLIAQSATDVIGRVQIPQGNALYNDEAGGAIGLLVFINRLIQISTIVAGIWIFFNIIFAGYIYITSSGDSAAHGKVRDKITMSILGIIVIIAAYTIAALIGLFAFGKADYFLNPTITGPAGATTTP